MEEARDTASEASGDSSINKKAHSLEQAVFSFGDINETIAVMANLLRRPTMRPIIRALGFSDYNEPRVVVVVVIDSFAARIGLGDGRVGQGYQAPGRAAQALQPLARQV